MATTSIGYQNPRRIPRQRRSSTTVDIILEATIQVLLRSGTSRLTTTMVAERAGVSVGSIYQYFPNKSALFFAVNDRYLDRLAGQMEELCLTLHGRSCDHMIKGVINEYIKIKTEHYERTAVLYQAATHVDVSDIVKIMCPRVETASEAMFATAAEAEFKHLTSLNRTLMNVLFGTVRTYFDRDIPTRLDAGVQNQLVTLFSTCLCSEKQTGVVA